MSDFDQLRKLTELKYARTQQALQDLVAKESKLRSELRRLQNQLDQSRQQELREAPMRMIGADVIWQRWVDRAKIKINSELVQVLAQKETRMAQARKAYGRVLVSRQIVHDGKVAKAAISNRATLAKAVEFSVFGIAQIDGTE